MSLADIRQSFRLANIMGTERKVAPMRVPEVNKNYMKATLERLSKDFERTPDYRQLELTEYQLVFVYCAWQRGGKQHSVIKDIIRTKSDDGRPTAWQAYTKDLIEVWQTNEGNASFPIALDNKEHYNLPPIYGSQLLARKAHLKGRLYLVRSDRMNVLDLAKQNGTIYKRKLVSLIVPYHVNLTDNNGVSRKSTELSAVVHDVWMYFGKHMYWRARIDGGYFTQPCDMFQHLEEHKRWIGTDPFYEFKAMEVARLPAPSGEKTAQQWADEYVPPKKPTTQELIEALRWDIKDKEKTNK